MDDTLRDVSGAAKYLGLPLNFFKNQLKHNTGPSYISPSERTKFFTTHDLDAWKSGWKTFHGVAEKVNV